MNDQHAQFLDTLTSSGYVRDPAWLAAFGAVPREVFVPEFFEQIPGGNGWVLRHQPSAEWAAGVFSNRPLITQLNGDDALTERARDGELVEGLSTSSSSTPTLMGLMLDAIAAESGDCVLEIGTGTGYNAALLCHRLRDDNVSSVDVDEHIVSRARKRLASLGYRPNVMCCDAATAVPTNAVHGRAYDRIIATVAVAAVPPAWIEQTRPGGIILFPLDLHNRGGLLGRLEVQSDGSARGRFLPDYGGFMAMRSHPRSAAADHAFRTISDTDGTLRTTTLPATVITDDAHAFEFFAALTIPGGGCDYLVFTPSDGGPPETWIAQDNGPWVCHITDPTTGGHLIRQGGPKNLWDFVESTHAHWMELGKPTRNRFGLTVSGYRHDVWLDDYRNRVATLATHTRETRIARYRALRS